MTENKELFRNIFEQINRTHDAEAFSRNLADSIVFVNPVTGIGDKNGMVGFHTGLFAAFPDINYHVDRIISQEDTVAAQCTVSGTQKGEFARLPATNKSISLPVAFITVFQRDKITHWYSYFDTATMMRQLGATK